MGYCLGKKSISLGMQVRRNRQNRSPRQMTEAPAAGPAPDAKSAAAPSGAAHSYPSTEDEEETSRPASQTSGSRCVSGLAVGNMCTMQCDACRLA